MQRGFVLLMTLALALGAIVPLIAPAPTRAAPTELFFSEYVEGTGFNRAVEIYNGTGASIDLATEGYNVQIFYDGSPMAGRTLNLIGSVAPDDVFVLANSNPPTIIGDQELAEVDFGGNDAVVLRKGTTFLDVIGKIGENPGTQWGTDPTSTEGATIRRNGTIEAGDSNGSDAFVPSHEWTGVGLDVLDGLGSHIFTGAPEEATQIWQIQGVGHRSPMADESVTDVEAVVTAVREADSRGRNGGFWIQDPTPDTDPLTSDGIFVHTESTPGITVGDLVEVDGTVAEARPFFEDLTITQIGSNPTWTVASSGNPLPSPVVVGRDRMPPTIVIDNDSSGSVEDGDAAYDPANDGIDFWETMEGMRLSVSDAVAVGPTNNFGEVAVVSRLQPGTGVYTERGGLIVRNLTDTGDYQPGDYQPGDFNPERLLLDDLLFDTPDVNVGDEFETDPIGVLDQSFGAFKLLVTAEAGRIDHRLQREVTAPVGPHDLAVATFNVENLSAVDSDAKVAELASQIVDNLRSPDLVAIEEMQDNSGDVDDEPDGDDGTVAADQSWQRLIDAIVEAGGPVYDYRQIDPLDGVDGGIPGGNIRVGFLFHSERGLEFVDRPGGDADTDTDVEPTPSGNGAQLTISPGRVLDAELGGDDAFFNTRKSLAGEFRFRGETIFVVANHFSSKGDDNPLYSQFQPPTRWTEFQSDDRFGDEDGWRHAQAQAVNDFVDEILALDDDAHVIVLGDINDFDFSETVGVLTGELQAVGGGPDQDGSGPTVLGEGAVMGTLFDLLAPEERYSYVFEGNSQVLDQILVSSSLLALDPSYDVVHVNAEFADQASDHDPSVMRVAFQPRRGR